MLPHHAVTGKSPAPQPLHANRLLTGKLGNTSLFQGRKYKLVVRRSYQEDFARVAEKAGLPPEFIPHSLHHYFASTSLAQGIPITEVSRWLGRRSIEVTHQIYGHPLSGSWDRARSFQAGFSLPLTVCGLIYGAESGVYPAYAARRTRMTGRHTRCSSPWSTCPMG
jgi:Phage integrase family